MRTLREHRRDFIAILMLLAAGIFSAAVILINQGATLPNWVPFIGSDRFELKAEFSTAQAVTPGQGQSINIAGISVGDVSEVELEDGHAVVTFEIENEYAPLINEDASLLLRPKTGLNDMVVEVDRGTSTEQVEEGDTLPLASTLPNVQPDEVLAALDADTQGFLRLLLSGGAEGLGDGGGRKLASALRQFEPFARDVARISSLSAKRRQNIRRSIHNFRLLSEELGDKDEELIQFVDTSNAVLGSFAEQEAALREAMQELPGALRETQGALASADAFALESAPALRRSLPGARALKPALEATADLFRETAGPIRDQIRPFTVQVKSPVHHVRQLSVGLGNSVPGLHTGFSRLNEGLNALAYNPPGAEEGYLFYVPWLNHLLNNTYLVQDAHGPIRRGLVLATCGTANIAGGTLLARPFLRMLYQLTGQLTPPQINALDPGACPF